MLSIFLLEVEKKTKSNNKMVAAAKKRTRVVQTERRRLMLKGVTNFNKLPSYPTSSKKPRIVQTERRRLMLKGVTNFNKLPSYPGLKVSHSKTKNNGVRTRPLPLSGSERTYSWDPWGRAGVTHDNCYDYAFGSYSAKRISKSVPGDRSGFGSNGMTFTTCSGIVKRVLSDNPGSVYRMSPSAKPKPGYYKVMCFVAPSNDFGNSTGDFHWYVQNQAVRYKIRPGDTVAKLARFFRVRQTVIIEATKKYKAPVSNTDGKIATNNSNIRIMTVRSTTRSPPLMVGKIIEFPVNLWSHKQGWASGPLMIDASGKTIVDPRRSNRSWKPGFHYTKFCSAYGVRRGVAQTGNNKTR
jgi:hypothetical protein